MDDEVNYALAASPPFRHIAVCKFLERFEGGVTFSALGGKRCQRVWYFEDGCW